MKSQPRYISVFALGVRSAISSTRMYRPNFPSNYPAGAATKFCRSGFDRDRVRSQPWRRAERHLAMGALEDNAYVRRLHAIVFLDRGAGLPYFRLCVCSASRKPVW